MLFERHLCQFQGKYDDDDDDYVTYQWWEGEGRKWGKLQSVMEFSDFIEWKFLRFLFSLKRLLWWELRFYSIFFLRIYFNKKEKNFLWLVMHGLISVENVKVSEMLSILKLTSIF
jgi:hypothetical protein